MSASVVLTTLAIFLGRVIDVSVGTLRIVAVVKGRPIRAFLLGFIEIGLWVLIISRVVNDLSQYPVYGVAYALGFALGNMLGIGLEKYLSHATRMMRIFTRQGEAAAARLREEGFEVTAFQGEGLKGPITMLFVESASRHTNRIRRLSEEVDPDCYYVVDDVLLSSSFLTRRRRKGK